LLPKFSRVHRAFTVEPFVLDLNFITIFSQGAFSRNDSVVNTAVGERVSYKQRLKHLISNQLQTLNAHAGGQVLQFSMSTADKAETSWDYSRAISKCYRSFSINS
jgi:hypothetical protein